jgi:hypothetical protein
MGIALWLGGGLAAFVVARLVPLGRGPVRLAGSLPELFAALFAASAFGLIATALDFGGWREADWRAGLFAALGAFAAAGTVRALRKNPDKMPVPDAKPGGSS